MKNNKIKYSLIAISFAIIILLICVAVKSSSIDIELYAADVTVDSSGNMEVTETWVIDYPSGYNVRFRDIEYYKNHIRNPLLNGLDYKKDTASFENSSASVTVYDLDSDIDITDEIEIGYSFNGDKDELGYPVECAAVGNCESIFVNLENHGGMKGKKSFTYTYKINGAVTQYSDVSELNWVFFDMSEAKVKRAELNIKLPSNSYSKEDILVWGHGTSTGYISIENNETVKIVAKNVSTTDKLEIRTVFPNSLVSNINEKNIITGELKDKIVSYETKLADETNEKINIINIINVITVFAFVLTVLMIIYIYKKYDKEYEANFKETILSEPPSDIKPTEMSYLYYFGKTPDEDVTATILDLVRRKVLLLKDKGIEITSDDPDFDIELASDYDESKLDKHEKILINMFINVIGDGKSVNTKDIKSFGKKYKNAEKLMNMGLNFTKAVKEENKNKNYFENARQKAFGKGGIMILVYFIIFILFFAFSGLYNIDCVMNILVIFVLAIVYLLYLFSIKRRTKFGNEEYTKWKAFKNYLEDFGNFSDYPIPTIAIWEKYLVYATSFKIADKVMKQLQVKLPDIETIEDSNLTFMRGYYYGRRDSFLLYHVISSSYHDARVNAMSTIAAHNASSGSGRGGGFSGGSSFGGGGGGGRSR